MEVRPFSNIEGFLLVGLQKSADMRLIPLFYEVLPYFFVELKRLYFGRLGLLREPLSLNLKD